MNRALRRMAIVVLAMFALLLAQVTRVQFIDHDFYANNQYNGRVLIDQYSVPRGSIYAGDTLIAHSVDVGGSQLRYQREYPESSTYANITGFISPTIGMNNLEQAENPVLTGEDSRFFFQRVRDTFTGEETLGGDLILSIDPDVHQAAYQALADSGVRGGIVMMEPQTGAVVAQASYPSWDPNEVASNDSAVAQEAWDALNDDDADPGVDRTRSNHAAPGSTFKTVVSAALIRELGFEADTMVPAGNRYEPPNTQHVITNASDQCPESELPLREAFARSCNTTFAQLCVDQLEPDQLRGMARDLGMGEEFATPLPTVASDLGDIDDPALRAQSCIGQQDVRMTVMQNAMIAATVANDGQRMEPNTVSEVRDSEGNTMDRQSSSRAGQVLTAAESQQMELIMRAVVEDGTGTNAAIDSHVVGGKTGTAENTDSDGNRRPNHGWFIGWAQDSDDSPAIAIAVYLANYGENASSEAADIAGDLMERYLTD
ncbi:penicillin-binding transpeptidase domain-containing protein [Natronoglycomyces albus]|uniref:Penicillin-binding protein 2 n=1 Tax=Natronoglycomyces albus TaxID=2811108 RepID=A0A895XT00_9ACTN|nr:penicillin-binding transpeptidase domain-containing protein [Natronoglycomyces albus]QSB05666.1 hypothetical protein JQS30_01680 [Natronoglycomyces albus]